MVRHLRSPVLRGWLGLTVVLAVACAAHPESRATAVVLTAPNAAIPRLDLQELLTPNGPLGPSPRARALEGKRVRLSGFMADMELPPTDALYLVPRPLRCDEAGGGSADLPPESVLVTSPSALPREHVPGVIEVMGILEVGNGVDERGRAANFRLRLEAPITSHNTTATPPG